jgi:peptidyl-prolyl cis-trans isomerase C
MSKTSASISFQALAVGALFLAAAAAPGCKRSADKPGHPAAATGDAAQVVAKVDDAVVTVGDVQERINRQSPFVRARYTTPDRKKEFLDSLIRFEVLANEAERRGYDKDPEVVRVMKQQMISKFLQKDFESKLKVEDVPDADVQKYYADHPAEFNQKDEVRVSEILVKDKPKADKVLVEIHALPKGAAAAGDQKAFRDLVTKYSEDEESKPRGGDLSFFDKDSTRYPKPIVDAAFKLGEVGDAVEVKTDKGWAIIRLTQKRPGFSRPLPEVKRQIQQRLFRDLRSKSMDAFVADLKKKSNIEIHEENLAKVVVDTGMSGSGSSPGMMPFDPGSAPHGGMSPGGMSPGGMSPHGGFPQAGLPPPGTPAPRAVVQGKQ